ncbi:porin family protein, partial [Mucilaginibacter sp.]|uniref:porin family protein n=1 Tax=Mucilaginibacter sp. TaxID=1882438 RepID=UPI00261E3E5E
MKKAIIITCLLLITCFYAGAQITYGAKISGGLAYQKINNAYIIAAGSIKTFNIRGIAQMPFKNGFWLEAGIGISGKGSVVYNDALTTTTHLTYLELPVNVLRKFKFTDLGVFYIGAGGYAAMGLGGKLDYETPGSSTSDNVRFGKADDAQKFDTGLGFSTGFEFRNKLTFNLAYSLGINNIASTTQQDSGTSVVKNRE